MGPSGSVGYQTMISVEQLCLGSTAAPALSDISFELQPGERCGLIGPPESGKSVLLKVVAGLIEPTAGSIRSHGETLNYADESGLSDWQRNVGMAFQNDALFDSMSVFENVAFPLRRRAVDETEIQERVLKRLDDVGLKDASKKFPGDISGGMRKRVGIARATIAEPKIGLFDEPTAGLDPLTSELTLELIVKQSSRLKAPTLIVSNDLAVLFPVCERVIMLHEGCVVFDGTVEAISVSEVPVVKQFLQGADSGPL
ncbi:MAG: ATP-binding cassette domain-containing protein [Deltaproteobacteria bacterium]|jgi:phospholipid/cholesterol/gamma-HCH transport system ATP-binding protein|nr:ATP-binding cassette domain-containing protein [Deltaproteobacteria bacterium]MBT6492276.1 ATP-binding cassette domain-containing protein [Deltaproteobacteria bacterium]